MTDTPLPSPTEPPVVQISPAAAARIRALMEADKDPDLMLRVLVMGGGCSGFSYGFNLERARFDDDAVFEEAGVRVVVDAASLDLLRGSVIDYTDDLMASAFTVRNPNATSTCGCGTSFAI